MTVCTARDAYRDQILNFWDFFLSSFTIFEWWFYWFAGYYCHAWGTFRQSKCGISREFQETSTNLIKKITFWRLFPPQLLCLIFCFLVLTRQPICYTVDVASYAFISIWVASGNYFFKLQNLHDVSAGMLYFWLSSASYLSPIILLSPFLKNISMTNLKTRLRFSTSQYTRVTILNFRIFFFGTPQEAFQVDYL